MKPRRGLDGGRRGRASQGQAASAKGPLPRPGSSTFRVQSLSAVPTRPVRQWQVPRPRLASPAPASAFGALSLERSGLRRSSQAAVGPLCPARLPAEPPSYLLAPVFCSVGTVTRSLWGKAQKRCQRARPTAHTLRSPPKSNRFAQTNRRRGGGAWLSAAGGVAGRGPGLTSA